MPLRPPAPSWKVTRYRQASFPGALKTGARLSHFEIIELIGRGGMGEVYLARDSWLKSDVDIKVLPESLARVRNGSPVSSGKLVRPAP